MAGYSIRAREVDANAFVGIHLQWWSHLRLSIYDKISREIPDGSRIHFQSFEQVTE